MSRFLKIILLSSTLIFIAVISILSFFKSQEQKRTTLAAIDSTMATTGKTICEKEIYISGNDTLPYRLFIPERMDPRKKYPLLLFLHGAAQRGNDNESQLSDIPYLLKDSAGRKDYLCYILVPQCPLNKRWVEVNWGDSSEVMPNEISISEKLTVKLLGDLERKLNVDSSRLYLVGLSMGGFGVWDLICRYPEKFAAAVPICGGGDERQAKKIIQVPIWAFHGGLDYVVKPCRSINMANAVNAAGGNAKLTIYPKEYHAGWNAAFADPELFKWIFAQRKK